LDFASFNYRFPLPTLKSLVNNGQILLDALAKKFPGKKISYVIPTHHHSDHFGGVALLAKTGTAIITTSGNRQLARQLAGNVKVITISDSISIGRREKRLVIYKTSNLHADEMLFAYLPEQGIIFEADITDYRLPAKQFLQYAEKRKLKITAIYGSHNSHFSTMADAEKDNPAN
jgi:flavorubredoxin